MAGEAQLVPRHVIGLELPAAIVAVGPTPRIHRDALALAVLDYLHRVFHDAYYRHRPHLVKHLFFRPCGASPCQPTKRWQGWHGACLVRVPEEIVLVGAPPCAGKGLGIIGEVIAPAINVVLEVVAALLALLPVVRATLAEAQVVARLVPRREVGLAVGAVGVVAACGRDVRSLVGDAVRLVNAHRFQSSAVLVAPIAARAVVPDAVVEQVIRDLQGEPCHVPYLLSPSWGESIVAAPLPMSRIFFRLAGGLTLCYYQKLEEAP